MTRAYRTVTLLCVLFSVFQVALIVSLPALLGWAVR